MSGAAVVDDLGLRGLLQDHTDEPALRELLEPGKVSLYHGIDPTAPSLHLGNLIGVLVLRRFQDAGHRPIALVGGATGMIGDPSGRSGERNLLDEAELATNLAGIRSQLERLLDFGGTTGADWSTTTTGSATLLYLSSCETLANTSPSIRWWPRTRSVQE